MIAKTAAGLTLAAAPAVQAGNAAKLSLRSSTSSEESEDLVAGAPIIAVLGVPSVMAGVVVVATENEDEPDSN